MRIDAGKTFIHIRVDDVYYGDIRQYKTIRRSPEIGPAHIFNNGCKRWSYIEKDLIKDYVPQSNNTIQYTAWWQPLKGE